MLYIDYKTVIFLLNTNLMYLNYLFILILLLNELLPSKTIQKYIQMNVYFGVQFEAGTLSFTA